MAEEGDRPELPEGPARIEEPELPAPRAPRAPDAGAVAPDPNVGDRVGGYELLALLGKGGAGSVFRARRERDGHVVALKVLAAAKVKRARVVQRFFDEVRAASTVEHPGLIRVHDFIEEERPRRLAYAMEYVDGEVLRARIKREGALDLRTAIQIAIQICDALEALHEHGIVHRDLKPENILVIGDAESKVPRVKLLDFGVVKFLPVDRSSGDARGEDEKPGTFVGTPRYMAPEQAAGATVDGRADLFSIGVMLFEMITGRCPHEGDSLRDVVLAKLKGAPRITMNPGKELLPQELTDVVDGCLQLKPGLRPAAAGTVAAALRDADMVLFAVGPIRADSDAERGQPERGNKAEEGPRAPLPPRVATLRGPVSETRNGVPFEAAPEAPPVPVSSAAHEPAPGPKNRVVWLLVFVCVAATIALIVVWQVRKTREDPVLMLPSQTNRVRTSTTS